MSTTTNVNQVKLNIMTQSQYNSATKSATELYMITDALTGTVTSVNNTSPDANGNVSLTIPTVNNATLTVTQNGTSVGTFTANSSTDTTIALTDTTYTAGTGIGITSSEISINQEENEDTYSWDVVKVGSITENDGVYSGFSSSKYLKFEHYPATLTSLEFEFIFTTSSNVGSWQSIMGQYNTNQTTPQVEVEDGYASVYLSSDGSSWGMVARASVSGNKTYKIYGTWNGTTFSGTLTDVSTGTSTNLVVSSGSATLNAINWTTYATIGLDDSNAPFQGSIDLKHSYIKANGELFNVTKTSSVSTVAKATNSLYGLIKPDNSSITVSNGVISSSITDNVTSTSTTSALSANQGKVLQDQITSLKGLGRFLSVWNCSTGLPATNPTESPYAYKTGDYYIVGTVASSGSNYRPNGSSYTSNVASTTVETGTVAVDDFYIYDGTNWKLLENSTRTVTFANIAGQPSDNTNLANALNGKVNTLTTVPTTGTYSKVTINSDGLVTSGADISSSDVTTALGFTPYDSSNPNGYTSNAGTVTSVNNVSPTNGNVSLTIPSVNSSTNYVPYLKQANTLDNSTLMYNSNAMAFTGRLHVGSSSPNSYYDKGRFTIYDNTASQQVTSMALLNYGGGGGCGVAIDMYNTSANGGIPSGRFGVVDNGNYSGYLQLQVKKSGAASNPLLPAMNIVPVPASNSLTTCLSFGQDEFNRVLFDLHKPEATVTITDSDKRWTGSGTTYYVSGSNKFNSRLLVAVGDIVSFNNFSTEATVTGVVSNSTTCQITVNTSLGSVSSANISVKKAYFKITDESDNIKVYVDPYGKFGIGTGTPTYNLDVVGTINASTDVKVNGTSVLTGITSTDVTTALGYTPYDSSNPNGYTSNTGTVTSVNNISPVNGNVTLSVPTVTFYWGE